jgi:hypothetical protein
MCKSSPAPVGDTYSDVRKSIVPDQLPFVVVVVIHWINLGDTIECLESLSKVNYPRLEVMLVNNGSPDWNEERIRQVDCQIQIVLSNENLGFTGGNNLGISAALRRGADLILLLNNDTVVHSDLIWSMIPVIQPRDVGVVGPVITYYDTPHKVWFAGGCYSRLLGYSYRKHPLTAFDSYCTVDWINGCALLAKREVFESIGLFWEPFFLNCEDLDLCLRAARAGYKCVLVGKALVRHKVSASGGIRGTDSFTPNKAYYFGRNYFLSLRRNASGFWAMTGFVSQFALALPYWTLHCILARNVSVIKHYLKGMWDGILGRTGKRATRV